MKNIFEKFMSLLLRRHSEIAHDSYRNRTEIRKRGYLGREDYLESWMRFGMWR